MNLENCISRIEADANIARAHECRHANIDMPASLTGEPERVNQTKAIRCHDCGRALTWAEMMRAEGVTW